MQEQDYGFFERFARLDWLMHRLHQQQHRDFGPMGNPHRGQGRILALLKLQPEISQKELCAILDIRPQSMGELLAKLERSGLITRTPSEADRRVMDIRLTEAGKEAAGQTGRPDPADLFSCLREEEQAALAEYLDRIIAALEQQLEEGPPPEDLEAPEHRPPFFGGEPQGRPGRPCHPPFGKNDRHPDTHGGPLPFAPHGFHSRRNEAPPPAPREDAEE